MTCAVIGAFESGPSPVIGWFECALSQETMVLVPVLPGAMSMYEYMSVTELLWKRMKISVLVWQGMLISMLLIGWFRNLHIHELVVD